MAYQSIRSSMERLKEKYEQRCTNCGLCVEVCPVYQMGDWGGVAPSKLHKGRLAAVSEGVVSDQVYDFTFSCSSCGACKWSCPEGLAAFEFTRLIRMAVADSGRQAPPGLVGRVPSRQDSFTRVSAALQVKPGEERWLRVVPESPAQADTVLFLGCNIHMMPDKIHTILDILDRLGLKIPVVAGIEQCCGAIEQYCGDVAAAEGALRHLVETLARFKPREVVHWCAGCHEKVLHLAPTLMEVPFRSKHIAQFLLDHVDGMTFQTEIARKVAVQDACTLGRQVGEYDPVRQLLAKIPGVQLVEMGKNRADSLCCGSLTQSFSPELATNLLAKALREAETTGATTMATVCHSCQRRFANGAVDNPLEVKSFVSLLGEAMGIVHEDKLIRYGLYHDPERVISEAAEYIEASSYPREELEALVRQYFR